MPCPPKTIFRTLRALGLAAMLTAVLLTPGSGRTEPFSPDIFKSVVSLLPEWPGAGSRPKEPEGTAVAIMPGGYLVTNDHIIGRARKIKIRLSDGRVLPADIVGRDALTDIALIKAPVDFPVLPLGGDPGLGEEVCAIGNQFGMGLSITCGVASALHRTGTGFNPIEDFIQTDAAVNPGASGGALVDGAGRLVGILSAIFTKKSDANLGVNFAASMRLVRRVTDDIIAHGKVLRGRIGARVGNLPRGDRRLGAVVRGVTPGGAAAQAGLRGGDIVTAIGDRAIRSASDVTSALHMYRIGELIQVTVRRDGAARGLVLRLVP